VKYDGLRRFAMVLILVGLLSGFLATIRICWEILVRIDPRILHLGVFSAAAVLIGMALLVIFPGDHPPASAERTVIRPGRSLDQI